MTAIARWSVPFLVGTNATFYTPDIAAIGSPDPGEFVVVWAVSSDYLGLGDASSEAIYGQRYSGDGTPQGAPFLVNATTSDIQYAPHVVSRNDDDGFAVSFGDFSGYLTQGFSTDVRLRYFDQDGNAEPSYTSDLVVDLGNPTRTAAQYQNSLARGEAFGLTFVTWTDTTSGNTGPNAPPYDGDGLDIRGALFNAAGEFIDEFRITTTTHSGETGFQAQSNVASLPRTGFVVTWTDDIPSGGDVFGGGSHIRGQLYSYLGVPIGGEFDIATVSGNTANTTYVSYPVSAGLNTTGTQFVTAWVQDDDTTSGVDLNVYARLFTIDAFGNAGGSTPFIVSQTTTANQSQVAITAYGTDRFLVVWTHQVPFQAPDIRARMFDANGNPLTDEFIVIPEDAGGNVYDGQIASVDVLNDVSGAGNPLPRFVITWRDGAGNVWGQTFSPTASEILGYDWFGSESGETYTAQYDEHRLIGNGGADFLTGSATSDDIYGGSGNDVLNGAGGVDQLYGGTGDDIFYVDTYTDGVHEGTGEGTFDQVYASVSYALTPGAAVERLATTSQLGTSAITLIGNEFGQQMLGNNGNNTLAGGGGVDSFIGYLGNDIYVVDHISETIVEAAGQGTDAVYTTVSYALGTGVSIERLVAAPLASTNQVNLVGNEIAQVVVGNNGVNYIYGLAGNDSLYGYGGNDVIRGDEGNDSLFGGTGLDQFVFREALGAASGIDRIYDLTAADTIVIDALAVATQAPITSNQFRLGTAALDADDRIIYDATSGAFWFDPDGTGAQAAILFGVIDGAPAGINYTYFDLM